MKKQYRKCVICGKKGVYSLSHSFSEIGKVAINKIQKERGFLTKLSEIVKIPASNIGDWYDSVEMRKEVSTGPVEVSQSVISETKGLEKEERKKVIEMTTIKELKLFVWEGDGVLTDWTNGMICVLAHNFEEALKLIEDKCSWCMNSFPVNEYKIIEEPEAFICWGGG